MKKETACDPVRSHENCLVPAIQVSTEGFPAAEQFDVWRELLSPVCDVSLTEHSEKGFYGLAQAYDVGLMHIISFETDRTKKFVRSKAHERKFGIDHWFLSFIGQGQLLVEPDGKPGELKGDMLLQTYASSFTGLVGGKQISCVLLDRDDLSEYASELDSQTDRNLVGPMATILREFLISIQNESGRLRQSDVPAINDAFVNLLKAAITPNADTMHAAAMPVAAAQLTVAQRLVAANLKSPDLTPDMLCAKLAISRRQLFYIFEPVGGVMKYITRLRLAACYREILRQSGHKMISTIAYEHGFTNLSSFYRQFHARYGIRPGEAREAWLHGHSSPGKTTRTVADWLLKLPEI